MRTINSLSMSSLAVLLLAVLAVFLSNLHGKSAHKALSPRAHRIICVAVFALGCFIRLFRLGTLPEGISAEEALVGVQAKALWQTGGFLFDGQLTTQLAQWTGESSGPLLAVLTAPFVGLFGLNAWTTRLPLALLSCAAMVAAYGIGSRLSGKRAARWCLTIYALCPYFVLSARMTCGACAAVCLLPIAVYALLKGMKRPACLYAGAILMGLMAYAQDMYFFISPLAVLIACCTAAAYGMKKRHALGACVMGLLICLPAMLTLWVNLSGAEGFDFLGIMHIPAVESFDKAQSVFDTLIPGYEFELFRWKVWAVITGGVFQVVGHLNISPELFAPQGLIVLYVISLPLMLLGGFVLLRGYLQGRRPERAQRFGRVMVLLLAAATLVCLVLYGSVGVLNTDTGCTSVFDYSSVFLFDALLMAAGLCRMERKSSTGVSTVSALFAACFVMLCLHLFGAGYRDNANVYFHGFGDLTAKAESIRRETDAKVNITGTVYPHIAPSDAAEMMYLYAADADMKEVRQLREEAYEVIYAPGVEEPDPHQVYLVTPKDITAWDLSLFHYEENGEYVLLSPLF